MKTNRFIARAGAALAVAPLLIVAAQAQNQPRSPFPWEQRQKLPNQPNNAAATNGDAAIRWQSLINSYAHR
ncbi:hypothetical protein MWN33_00410 [Starkeya koreensis]|uniref:Uncharacterized protein n=1 Tax=Ancylobacter koreensis TaxID=266121 RepID=A0ABT0DGT9_9HYPH|nr:hypothetical protein [Ancylobacter koreensis]MCK0206491.1 hypothetical protein [Ancylobacter koreensis]